jgi:hypothetical protein
MVVATFSECQAQAEMSQLNSWKREPLQRIDKTNWATPFRVSFAPTRVEWALSIGFKDLNDPGFPRFIG